MQYNTSVYPRACVIYNTDAILCYIISIICILYYFVPDINHHLAPCSQSKRQQSIKTICDRQKHVDNLTGLKMQYVLMNHDTKQLVCMISPAISQKRLARIASQRDVREDIPHDDDRLHEYQGNIEYAENVSLTYIMNRYSQYRKTAIVQHPLQWLVSLYYSTVLINDKYSKQGGVRVTILEFLRDVKDYLDIEPHWQSYENMCHYCSVEYDYIIKTETSQEDVMILTDSKIADSPFKYDSLLRSLADDSIAVNIAKLYEREMTMFGYQWDMAEHKSSCTNWELYEYKQCC